MRAIEIRIRAERRAGQLLKEMKETGERQKAGGDRKSKSSEVILIPDLSDLHVSLRQSSDWQKLAQIPDKDFEKGFRKGRANC